MMPARPRGAPRSTNCPRTLAAVVGCFAIGVGNGGPRRLRARGTSFPKPSPAAPCSCDPMATSPGASRPCLRAPLRTSRTRCGLCCGYRHAESIIRLSVVSAFSPVPLGNSRQGKGPGIGGECEPASAASRATVGNPPRKARIRGRSRDLPHATDGSWSDGFPRRRAVRGAAYSWTIPTLEFPNGIGLQPNCAVRLKPGHHCDFSPGCSGSFRNGVRSFVPLRAPETTRAGPCSGPAPSVRSSASR